HATGLNATPEGVKSTFTNPLDPERAGTPDSYSVEVWNYNWTWNYGSGEYSTLPDGTKKHDSLTVKSVKLSEDGKSVFLEIDGMKPVMQMKILMRAAAADKSPATFDIYNTIHEL